MGEIIYFIGAISGCERDTNIYCLEAKSGIILRIPCLMNSAPVGIRGSFTRDRTMLSLFEDPTLNSGLHICTTQTTYRLCPFAKLEIP